MRSLRALRFLALPFLLACMLAPPVGSQAGTPPRVKPSAGDYEAAPLKVSGVYQLGAFSVVNEAGKRRIVSSEQYQGIFYPDIGKCDGFNVPLSAEAIPISHRGRFSIRDKYPIKGNSIVAVWKGAWVKPKKVAGSLKIAYKGCSSKIKWVGKRSAAPTG
jgi:hypothetical protein